MKITKIQARQILDSRGNPTIECDVVLSDGSFGRASVPSGASKGSEEAIELRDNDSKRFNGKGVLKAIENIDTTIVEGVYKQEIKDQFALDNLLLELDGTNNKSSIGANAILAVSLAFAKAAANARHQPLYEYIHELSKDPAPVTLPMPLMNVMNGGAHASFATDIQEYMIIPVGATTFHDALRMGTETFHTLKSVLKEKNYPTTVGDEGGFAPMEITSNEEPMDFILSAIEKAGYTPLKDIAIGLDGASTEFYKNGTYELKKEGKNLTSEEMVNWISGLVAKYPIISLEDMLSENDWNGWKLLTEKLGSKYQIVGDDLFVTNVNLIQKGIDEQVGNAVLIKPNQIGTLTETLAAISLSQNNHYKTIISHRSGETDDTTIAHIAVGTSAGQIKAGAPSRGERVAKYNELLRIEEELGSKAKFSDWVSPILSS